MRPIALAIAICACIGAIVSAATAANSATPAVYVAEADRLYVFRSDLSRQAKQLEEIQNRPMSDNPVAIPWLMENAGRLTPIFVLELARRVFEKDRRQALMWFSVGMIRARYDGLRCADATSRQGLMLISLFAGPVAEYARTHRVEYGAAGQMALAREDLFAGTASPDWICIHGIAAMREAVEGKKGANDDWLVPESEWPGLRSGLRRRYERLFAEQGRPQNDPIPRARRRYKVRALPTEYIYDQFAWLDSGRLALHASRFGKKSKTTEGIYLWSAEGERLRLIASGNYLFQWCAARGAVAYEVQMGRRNQNGETRYVYKIGPLGHEKTGEFVTKNDPTYADLAENTSGGWKPSGEGVNYRQNRFDCSWHADDILSRKHGVSGWLPLLPGDGYLAFADRPNREIGRKSQVSYYASKSGESVPLDINWPGVRERCVRYYEFRRAYFISVCGIDRKQVEIMKKQACVPSWWFWPRTGRLDRVCTPVDSVNDNLFLTVPTRKGLARIVWSRQTYHDEKPGGVYLEDRSGSVGKIYAGRIRSVSVSPDGCRIAVRADPVNNDSGQISDRTTVEVIELCG